MNTRLRAIVIWVGIGVAVIVPIAIAAKSPLLAWRQPVYILAGFAGVIGLTILFLQPLLARGILPGMSIMHARRLHKFCGIGLVAAIAVHVSALWITSPPDVLDALLFRSPTPFSVWGVIAMWTIFASALIAGFRNAFRMRTQFWQRTHLGLTVVIVGSTVAHAVMIEGTMGVLSKAALCSLIVAGLIKALWDKRQIIF